MTTSKKTSSEGLWLACVDMESAALNLLSEQLIPFEVSTRQCYEAGVQVTTLKSKRHGQSDITLAALFLKKALNDLRSVWLLLHLGYTSQAASVAASLFENALTVTSIAGNEINVQKLKNNQSGDLPWSPQQLAKMLAKQWQEEAETTGEKFDNDDFETAWKEIYAGYKWLCKIKHPTIRSAVHEASSTSITSGEYVVMAAPDVRSEDITVKATILSIAINRVYGAIRSFSFGLECDTTTNEYETFTRHMREVSTEALKAFKELANQPLPFNISDSALAKDWAKSKAKSK